MSSAPAPLAVESARLDEPRPSTSAIETVHEALRDQIIAGEIPAGERLHVARLREEFGVGTSTVREALSRLLNDALVTSEAQRGFRVVPMSLKDFRDITEARRVIETTAVRTSLEQRDDEWEATLVAAYHRLTRVEDRLIGDGDTSLVRRWHECNAGFHDALVANCSNAWLVRFRHTLHLQSHRYHLYALQRRLERRDVRIEHRAIFDAAMAGDVEACVARTSEHVERTLATMLPVLSD